MPSPLILELLLLFFLTPILLPFCSSFLFLIPPIAILYFLFRSRTPPSIPMRAFLYSNSHPHNIHMVTSLPRPQLQKNCVLIKVKAAAINPVDYKLITSKIPFLRFFLPHTVGRDFAGVVIAKDERVKEYQIGDRVFGNAKGGSLQEYTVARTEDICKISEELGFEQAAGLGLAGSTSLQVV